MNGRGWLPAELRKLRRIYANAPTGEIAKLLGHPVASVYHQAALLGVRKSAECRRRMRAAQRPTNGKAWTEAQLSKLRSLYPHKATAQVAKLLGHPLAGAYGMAQRLGLHKSAAYLASSAACRLRRGDNLGGAHRFGKGHVPANKGLRRPGYAPGRMAETQFKKGQRSRNCLPVGTVKGDGDGYLRIKVSAVRNGNGGSDKAWEFIHRRVWEAAHGPIPKSHRIWWKDRDHANCALENLELLSGAEHMARTTIHNYPPELEHTIQLAGALKRRIRRMEERHGKEQNDGPSGSSIRDHRVAEGPGQADGH